jgi:hypothetical protein
MAAATDEAQLKQAFAAELHSIKSDLQALKSKFYDRQASRNKLHDAQAALQGLGPAVDPANPFAAGALQELQQLVAAELLDPACTLPIPADALHRKVCMINSACQLSSLVAGVWCATAVLALHPALFCVEVAAGTHAQDVAASSSACDGVAAAAAHALPASAPLFLQA